MSDFYDEINALINDIVAGRATKRDAEKKIEELKEEFGRDTFPSINFEKEPRPWSKDYLFTLKRKNITGACSEEFIRHMAEVSEDVYSKKRKTIIGIIIVSIVVLILAIITLAFSMGSRKQTEGKDTSCIEYKDNVETIKITGNDDGYDNIV